MASKVGQSVSQSLGGVGLAGGSMLLRLRRTSIALLALVGAVGLGLIVFISQLGWPAVLNSPLPGAPAKVKIERGVALTQPASPSVASGVPATRAGGTAGRDARRRDGKGLGARSADESRLGGAKGLTATTGAEPGSGTDAGQPVSQPTPPPAAAPEPVTSPPASPGAGSITASTGGSSPAGSAKAANDGARSANLASSKSQGPKTAGTKDSSPVSSKAGEASSKAKRDESAAVTNAPPAAAPAPPSSNPAAAKEAADAAR